MLRVEKFLQPIPATISTAENCEVCEVWTGNSQDFT